MQTQTSNPTISETLAAMDAVNAARDAEELLNDEINIEERKTILREKLKATYAANNIIVSDDIINKGVNDFFANRYAFRKMPRSLTTLFAWLFVKRRLVFRWTAIFAVFVILIIGATYVTKSAQEASQRRAVEKKLADAKAEQAKAIAAKKAADDKQAALAKELSEIPANVNAIRTAIDAMAKEPGPKNRAAALAGEAIAQAEVKDIESARRSYLEMKNILSQLSAEYKLIIQQSPKTALWRVLDRNPNLKRYYVIVNAVDSNNKPVGVSIKNEEDSTVKVTSIWAEQIPQSLYESLRLEKETRGVLTNRLFAEKTKGYLNPEYKQGLKSNNPNADAEALRITKW